MTRETIEVIKEAIQVMEKTITYKCPVCGVFHKQESPHLPIEGSIARVSLIAQVITDKTANALPLYRQSEDYKRIGLALSRQTLSNWMIKSSQLLDIIYQHMKKTLLEVKDATQTYLRVSDSTSSLRQSYSFLIILSLLLLLTIAVLVAYEYSKWMKSEAYDKLR